MRNFAAIATLMLFSGCSVFTGTAYHAGVNKLHKPAKESQNSDFRGVDTTVVTHSATLYSSEGLFTSVVGSSANAYEARQLAQKRAAGKAETGDFSDTEYSYEVLGPMPGLNDYFRFTFGSSGSWTQSTPSMETPFDDDGVTMYGFELGNYFPLMSFGDLPLALGLYVNTVFSFWSSENEQLDEFFAGIPIGLPLTYHLTPQLALSIIPEFDPVMFLATGLVALLLEEDITAIQYAIRGKVSFAPFVEWLRIELDTGLEWAQPNFIGYNATQFTAKGGLVFNW